MSSITVGLQDTFDTGLKCRAWARNIKDSNKFFKLVDAACKADLV